MKISLMFFLFVSLCFLTSFNNILCDEPNDKMEWWHEARFGMFIHWGIYSVPAGIYKDKEIPGIGEWIMNTGKVPVQEYAKYVEIFNPKNFDAEQWVMLAKAAGMKYIVITSKHHDGFAMFNSNASDFNIASSTPFKRDPLKELADACHKNGVKLGFYYSQAQDWHHAGGTAIGGHWDSEQDGDMDSYINNIAVPQVKEILSNYGKIDILWWDTPAGMTSERANKFLPLLDLQPGIIINNRLGGGIEGDFQTPEQYIPDTGIDGANWEACMTMNDTWGYKSKDNNWKSTKTLLHNLIDIASKGGNYLLNVGPNSLGEIPNPSVIRLKQIGKWLKTNGEAIYGSKASPFSNIQWGRCTQKQSGNSTNLYLHIFEFPDNSKIQISGLQNKIEKVYALADPDKKPLSTNIIDGTCIIDISEVEQYDFATVIVLQISGIPKVYNNPEIIARTNIFINQLPLEFASNEPGTDIRYTLDNSEPLLESPLYIKKLVLTSKSDIVIKAKCFVDNKAVTGTTVRKFRKVLPASSLRVNNYEPGINYKYYTGIWEVMPALSSLAPMNTGTINNFDVSVKDRRENYGIVFEGLINVPADDIYKFYLESDDGSIMEIDDNLLIDNDGLHAMIEKSGEAALAKGFHRIKVYFFQRGGDDGLKLSWESNGGPKTPIDDKILFRENN